jgi:two-component system response regulator RegA
MKKSLLIVEDDSSYRTTLGRVMQNHGFEVQLAASIGEALEMARHQPPEYAIVDLKMPGGSGLLLIPELLALDSFTRIVVLTGYAGIATAVEAIKLGAIHYLAKPVTSEEILEAFNRQEGDPHTPLETPETLSVNEVEWQHILTVLERNGGNISASARELKLHRRTLQRKLEKRGYRMDNPAKQGA